MYELGRLIVRFQICLLLIAFLGCESDRSRVPVPLTKTPPYSYQGTIKRIWGGDNFEVVENDKIHFAYMRGVDTPEFGQFGHDAAVELIHKMTENRTVTIHVVGRDEWKREVCDTTLVVAGEEIDPAVELLENGLAWFDLSDGPYAKMYRDMEERARDAKIGIWSQPNPIPPWEYWVRHRKRLTEDSN